MSQTNLSREAQVSQLIEQTRQVLTDGELAREQLNTIRALVEQLAARAGLWNAQDFPDPAENEFQSRYRLGAESDDGITLYLNVMRPGKVIKPHDHTTWACIAGVEGVEMNTRYDRTDDQSVPGKASITATETIALGPGKSIGLMPDDIHSVRIEGEHCIRHLHLYGRPLENLDARKSFDLERGTYQIMDIGVKSKG
ncbi:MAG: hypothetical protein AB8C46_10295 [Burkholderiaceae bacterium]